MCLAYIYLGDINHVSFWYTCDSIRNDVEMFAHGTPTSTDQYQLGSYCLRYWNMLERVNTLRVFLSLSINSLNEQLMLVCEWIRPGRVDVTCFGHVKFSKMRATLQDIRTPELMGFNS